MMETPELDVAGTTGKTEEMFAFGKPSSGLSVVFLLQSPIFTVMELTNHLLLLRRCDIDGYDGDRYEYVGSNSIIEDDGDDAVVIRRSGVRLDNHTFRHYFFKFVGK